MYMCTCAFKHSSFHEPVLNSNICEVDVFHLVHREHERRHQGEVDEPHPDQRRVPRAELLLVLHLRQLPAAGPGQLDRVPGGVGGGGGGCRCRCRCRRSGVRHQVGLAEEGVVAEVVVLKNDRQKQSLEQCKLQSIYCTETSRPTRKTRENCEIISSSNNGNNNFCVFYLHDLVHLDPDYVGRQQQEIGRRHRRHQEGVPHLGPEEGVGDEEAGLGGQAVQPSAAAGIASVKECNNYFNRKISFEKTISHTTSRMKIKLRIHAKKKPAFVLGKHYRHIDKVMSLS